MCRIPARLSPRTMRVAPPTTRRTRQDIDQALSKVRRGQPEQREDRREPDDECDRVTHGEPSARPGQPAARDGDRTQLSEVRRDERQHAR